MIKGGAIQLCGMAMVVWFCILPMTVRAEEARHPRDQRGFSFTQETARREQVSKSTSPQPPGTTAPGGVSGEWTACGPWSGTVLNLCQDSSGVLFAGVSARSGVYRSRDQGTSWEQCGLDGYSISSLAADIAEPGWLYAGTYAGSAFRSTDGGDTWQDISAVLPGSIRDIAPDPQESMVVLAGNLNATIYRSTDGGTSWAVILSQTGPFGSLAYDTTNPDIVFCGLDSTILKSTDRGSTWSDASTGIPDGVTVTGIAVSPDDPDRVYACSWPNFGTTRIHRSTDGGALWQTVAEGRGGNDIRTDPDDGNSVYAIGPFSSYSTDGGDSWTYFPSGFPEFGGLWATQLLFDAESSDRWFVSLHGEGIVRSTDGGSSWASSSTGINATNIQKVFIPETDPETICAVTSPYSGGFYRSSDGGRTWSISPPQDIQAWNINGFSLAGDPTDLQMVFLGDWNGSFKSSDGGKSWVSTTLPGGLSMRATSFAFGPQRMAERIYAGDHSFNTVYLSDNEGDSWVESGNGLPAGAEYLVALAMDPEQPEVLYVGDCENLIWLNNGTGVYKSTDAGQSWWEANTGLYDNRARAVTGLVIDPSNPSAIFAGTGHGIYWSEDGAGHWSKRSDDLDQVTGLAVSPFDPQMLLAAGRRTSDDARGVFLSTDQGISWHKLGSGLPQWSDLILPTERWSYPWVGFDPSDPGRVWAAVGDRGLWTLDGFHVDLLVAGPGPGPGNPPRVRVFPPGQDAQWIHEFEAYGAGGYGVNVSSGDLNGDGADEILTGAGPGAIYGPHVRGFLVDGTPLPQVSFLAYGTNKYGVNVACGDLDGDEFDEIITGAGPGAVFGPHVRAFDYDGTPGVIPLPGVSFFAYGTPKWGVNVSAGDLDGDGYDEIVTGAGPGAVYGPHVRAWNVDGETATAISGASFLAYGTNQYGVNVTCGDVDGDGIDEIITGAGPGAQFGAHIRGFEMDGTPLNGLSFFALPPNDARFGATVFAGTDLDNDGSNDLLVGAGPDPEAGSPIKTYRYDGSEVTEWFSLEAFSGMTHGANVTAGAF